MKKTISKLKKELDKWFSLYIRIKDSNEYGYVQCTTCSVVRFYKDGMSEQLNIFEKIYYESLVRLNNKQNVIYVIVLAILHFLNFIKNKFFKFNK